MNTFLQRYWRSLLLMVILTVGIYFAGSNSTFFKSDVTLEGTGFNTDSSVSSSNQYGFPYTGTVNTQSGSPSGNESNPPPSGDGGTFPPEEEIPPAPICGDGKTDPGEACDDGNNIAGDGCFNCQLEQTPVPGPSCGDGVIDAGEECENSPAGIVVPFGLLVGRNLQCIDCKLSGVPTQEAATPEQAECPADSPCVRVIEMTHLQIDHAAVPPVRTFKMVVEPTDVSHDIKVNADIDSVKTEEKVDNGVHWYLITIPLDATLIHFDIDGIIDAFSWDYVAHGDADWDGKLTLDDFSKMNRYFMSVIQDTLKMISQFVVDLKM